MSVSFFRIIFLIPFLFFSAVSTRAEVSLGVAGPLTGANAAFGQQLIQGVTQAVEDINRSGGLLGEKIILERGDDMADPKQGVSVANKFAGEGVKFVVGHFNSGVSIPSSIVYSENGILMISPASTNPNLTERGLWNTFRTCGRDDQQGAVAASYITNHLSGKRVAILHDKTTYGYGLANETKKALNAAGVKEVIYEGVNVGDKDFSTLVSKMKIARAEVVYWGGLHPEGGLIVRQMNDQGLKAVFMSGDGIASNEFASVGGPGVEGTLMTFASDPRRRPEAKAVIDRYTKKGVSPESYTLYSYAAVQVIQQAAEKVGTLDPRRVAAQIRTGQKFNTVVGPLSYDEKGDITRVDYVVYKWLKGEDGKLTYFQTND